MKIDTVCNTQQLVLDRLKRLESFTVINIPPQPMLQHQYQPTTNAYQQYPASQLTNLACSYQQVTPDAYYQQYSTSSVNTANTYPQHAQYLGNTPTQVVTDPYHMTSFSATMYQQQHSVTSTSGQEQYPVTSVISSFGMNQNDSPNSSQYVADNSCCQEWYVNEATPCKIKYHRNAQNALSSSEINKQSLRSVQEILEENNHLRTESCAGTLCQRLAKEAIFGEDIMKRCTPYGTRDSPGLPRAELYELKMLMFRQFPRFHRCPSLFEDVWKKCIGSIEQACRRLRLKERKN